MRNYQPTYGIRDTAQNIKFFVAAHQGLMWSIVKPLLPCILILNLVDAVITALYFSGSEYGFGLGGLLSAYFLTCIAISWHRVIIDGPDRFIAMDPFRPKRSELGFIGSGLLLGVMVFAIVFIAVFFSAILGSMLSGGNNDFAKGMAGLGAMLSIVVSVYLAYKFSFYFPAKAVDANLTFSKSFRLTQGYFWKMLAAPLLASLRVLGMMFLYLFLVFSLFFGGLSLMGYENVEMPMVDLVLFVLSIPVIVYFQPLLTVIGVTGLSNYYMHAMQNRLDAVSGS